MNIKGKIMSTDPQFPSTENLGIAVYSNNAEAIGNDVVPLIRPLNLVL